MAKHMQLFPRFLLKKPLRTVTHELVLLEDSNIRLQKQAPCKDATHPQLHSDSSQLSRSVHRFAHKSVYQIVICHH